jgi:hypothetical protein
MNLLTNKAIKGHALLLSMIFILTASMVLGVISFMSTNSVIETTRHNEALRAFHMAEGTLQKIHGDINLLYLSQGGLTEDDMQSLVPLTNPTLIGQFPELEDYNTISESGDLGLEVARLTEGFFGELEGGSFRGLMAQQQDYEIDISIAHTQGKQHYEMQDDRRYGFANIHETLRAQAIPMAQFFAFYDNDLEFHPGPTMFAEGRIHSNANLWIGAGSGLTIDAGMTAVGSIWHDRKDSNNVASGDVKIWNGLDGADGAYVSMNQGGQWLDNNSDNWAQDSVSSWNSMVQSKDHDVPKLRLPINLTEDPHDVLERSDPGDSIELQNVKFHNKAGLRIIDGVATDGDGNPVSLTYPDPNNPGVTKSVVSNKSWSDYREGKTAKALQINVGNLIESGIAPANGIIYVSKHDYVGSSSKFDAVRLSNGAQLPGQGFTVATDLPLYTKGDYNTINKTSTLLAADAVNILSNNWKDSNSSYSSRYASNTNVNAVIMMGNTETVLGGNYNGGLENSMRFSEKWSGKKLSFRGSLINLWNSETATGNWRYGSPIYTAPQRDWRFDPYYLDPLNAPPGIPTVYAFETVSFAHSY